MLVLIALLTPVLLLFCGLVVDVGQMQIRRLQMQNASDAAAIGAALEIERGSGKWVAAGRGDASINDFTDGDASTTVNVQLVPTYGAYQGFYDAVQANISHRVSFRFMGLAGVNLGTVSTQSTALIGPCVYVTGAANLVSPAFTATSATIAGTSQTVNKACPWYLNHGVSTDSGTTFTSLATNIVGSAASSTWNASGGPPPRYNVATTGDPLAYITQPSFSSCQYSNVSYTDGATHSLSPGVYCGGLTVKSGTTINFAPGLYVFTGGMNVQSNSTLNGTGVTFFFTRGGSSSYGTVSIADSSLNLIAPVSSSNPGVPGVVLMNDSNWVHTSAQDFQLNNTNFFGDGMIYLTGTGLSITNTSQITAKNYLGIDVDNLIVNNSTLQVAFNYASLSGGSPMKPQGGLVQ